MCKRLVELMGGVNGVGNTIGKGRIFWVELNLTAETQLVTATAEFSVFAQARIQGGALLHTPLYVEDNPASLILVEDFMAPANAAGISDHEC